MLRAIFAAIRKAVMTALCLPLGLLSAVGGAMGQSQSMPAPVRKAAKSLGDLASARLVRRYAKALANGRDNLPDLKRLPKAARAYAEKLTQAEAGRVAGLDARQVLSEIEKTAKPDERKRAEAAPQPRPSATPSHVRRQIRERRRQARPGRAPRPEPTDEPEPAVIPRA